MTLEDLEEALENILQCGFQIETDNDGQIVIYTGLTEIDDGELVPIDESSDNEDYDEDMESYDESDDEDY
jgi:hypothetical protein